MPLDYRSELENQAWSLLEADTSIQAAFPLAKRVKELGDGWLRNKWKGAPNSYPRLKIELRGGRDDGLPPHTFGMNKTGTLAVDFAVPKTQQLAVILTFDESKTAALAAVPGTIEAIFMREYPKFGLSYVFRFDQPSITTNSPKIGDVTMKQITMLWTFHLRPMLSQLTA